MQIQVINQFNGVPFNGSQCFHLLKANRRNFLSMENNIKNECFDSEFFGAFSVCL